MYKMRLTILLLASVYAATNLKKLSEITGVDMADLEGKLESNPWPPNYRLKV